MFVCGLDYVFYRNTLLDRFAASLSKSLGAFYNDRFEQSSNIWDKF